MAIEDKVKALPCWSGRVEVAPLGGGITNLNFVVQDDARKAVVRIGDDIVLHQITRANELAASRAAHAGVSPAVIHHEPGVLVIDFIEGRTLTAADVQTDAMLAEAVALVQRAHRVMPDHLRGPSQVFWVFHVLRDYAATLRAGGSRHLDLLPGLMAEAVTLERAVGPIDLVYGHNDLLPANFLHDGTRLWLIDWEYGAFGTAMFDLANLAAANSFSAEVETNMLQQYLGKQPDLATQRAYSAMKVAAALREAMWGMVSELHLSAPGVDYVAYAAEYINRFDQIYNNHKKDFS
jgi:thiamine kinase-like enzyme